MTTTITAPLSPLEIVRNVALPDDGRIYPRVEAIRDCYLLATGRSLDCELAIWCLDALRAERGSR